MPDHVSRTAIARSVTLQVNADDRIVRSSRSQVCST
jgi:hypothetical protein